MRGVFRHEYIVMFCFASQFGLFGTRIASIDENREKKKLLLSFFNAVFERTKGNILFKWFACCSHSLKNEIGPENKYGDNLALIYSRTSIAFGSKCECGWWLFVRSFLRNADRLGNARQTDDNWLNISLACDMSSKPYKAKQNDAQWHTIDSVVDDLQKGNCFFLISTNFSDDKNSV